MKTVISSALGECVHVAGETNFLRMAEQFGWRTVFLGPAVSMDSYTGTSQRENVTLVGISCRLPRSRNQH
jgi:methanogenic corrinoid protein MtbC1